MGKVRGSIEGKFHYRLGGWKYNTIIRALLFLFLALLFYMLFSGRLIPKTYDIQMGQPSPVSIHATREIVNTGATEKAKNEAAQSVQNMYKTVSLPNEKFVQTIYDKIEQINSDSGLTDKTNVFQKVIPALGLQFIDSTMKQLSDSDRYDQGLLDEMKKQLVASAYQIPEEIYYKLPNITKQDISLMKPVTKSIVSNIMNDQVTDVPKARAKIAEMVNASQLSLNTQRELVQEIARFSISPNQFFDKQATNAAKQQASSNTKTVYIQKNDVIVQQGDLVTPDIYKELNSLNLLKNKVNYQPQLGLILLSILLVLVLYMIIRQSDAPISTNNVPLIMFVLIIFLNTIIMKSIALGQSLGYPYIGFIAPVGMGVILISILLEVRLAIVSALIFSIISSIIYNTDGLHIFDFRYGFISLVIGFVAIFSLHKASQRSTILKAGVVISLLSMVSVLSLILLNDHYTYLQATFALSFALAGGLLTAVFVIGILPFFEVVFGILSPLKLVELSNPNHPLLRKLLTETPGTYHHSVMVGNLSEAAAEAIGVDGLLCRVGSFYHDIGKTKRPNYFIENQNNMGNPHDTIEPSLSKSIIIAHARDGVELLKEYKIPKAIRDIAEQHHGTTLLKYFYHKANNQLSEGEKLISEKDYRYPGPKAQSKEAAVVGICDSVEAAVRSLRNPSIEQIDSMVRKIIKDRLDDEQFNESDITLKELETIAKAVKETLLGIFHSRIEYPENLPQKVDSKGVEAGA